MLLLFCISSNDRYKKDAFLFINFNLKNRNRNKMFKILSILLLAVASLLPLSDSSLNSNNFCKLEEKHCSSYAYQCGPSICTRNETECKYYLKIESQLVSLTYIDENCSDGPR